MDELEWYRSLRKERLEGEQRAKIMDNLRKNGLTYMQETITKPCEDCGTDGNDDNEVTMGTCPYDDLQGETTFVWLCDNCYADIQQCLFEED